MKKFISAVFVFFGLCANAQQNFFQDINENFITNKENNRVINPKEYRTLKLDFSAIKSFLQNLPDEKDLKDRNNTPILEIPMPNGSTAKFNVWQSLVMESGLASDFPNIRTYLGQGITDKYATIRFDVTELGFHAMILSSISGAVFIDPYNQNTTTEYISYYKKNFTKVTEFDERVIKKNRGGASGGSSTSNSFVAGQCAGSELRTYRLAVGCTNQYAKAATGKSNPTKAEAMSAITTTVNRVVGVYEQEVGIRMVLIANNQNIVYVSSSVDTAFGPNNSDPGGLLDKSQSHITLIMGSANFDIGHTFSTGGGGVAILGCVCDDDWKASGITGQPTPVGDPYDIDFVAHEMGHQFGADHTFNANTSACSGNGASTSNVEPGSGTTIMAYAGICGTTNDLQPHSDPQFHAASLAEILDFSILDAGNNCAVVTQTGNVPPVVNISSATMTIPINTPFVLRGFATDANNDSLTYSWEQIDIGGAFGNWNRTPQTTNIPLFRSFEPVPYGERIFTKPFFTGIGERLPSIARTMKFRLTVRDNRAGGGGTCFKDVTVTTNTTVTNFLITYPTTTNITWYNSESRTITWNTNATGNSPYNISNVAIELSTNSGESYTETLLASTPNDGSETIIVPARFSNTCRIRIRGVNNMIFSQSSNDFTIAQNPLPVSWININAKKENNYVKINWRVNEIGNHFYHIEKSSDGKTFENIGKVNSYNNGKQDNSYSFNDLLNNQGRVYYRVKQTDIDGRFSYSSIVWVELPLNNKTISLYPNPASNIVNITAFENFKNSSIEIFDVSGKQIFLKQNIQINAGEKVMIDVSSFPKGVYQLRISSKTQAENLKLVVN